MPRFERTTDLSGTLVRLSGELDITTAHEVDVRLRAAEGQTGGRVVVDMAMVTFVDARGIDVLTLSARRCAGSGGSFRLEAAPKHFTRIVNALGRERLPELTESIEHQPEGHLTLVA